MFRQNKVLTQKQMAMLLAMMIAIMPFSIDAYLPALTKIAASLNTNIYYIERSLSSFIFGAAIGQIIGGSLSDIKGRRNIALIGLGIYVVSSLLLIGVQNAGQLLTIRIIQAIGAGMSAVTVGAIVRDNYQGREAAQMFVMIGIVAMTAPLLSPLIGSFLESLGGWRSIFAFLSAYGLFLVFTLFFFLPQNKKAEPIRLTQLKHIGTRYIFVLKNWAAMGFLAYQAASFSVIVIFFSESPFVYMDLYGLTSHQYAWLFASNVIVMMLCNRFSAWALKRDWALRDLLRLGLLIQFISNSAALLLVLLLKQPPLFWLAPLIVIAIGAQGLISANTSALFMSNYKPKVGGSANAVLSSSQSLISALVGFFTTMLHNGTILVMVGMMFAVMCIGLILLYYFSGDQVFTHKLRSHNVN